MIWSLWGFLECHGMSKRVFSYSYDSILSFLLLLFLSSVFPLAFNYPSSFISYFPSPSFSLFHLLLLSFSSSLFSSAILSSVIKIYIVPVIWMKCVDLSDRLPPPPPPSPLSDASCRVSSALSHDYFTMWNVHYSGIEKTYAPSDVLFVRYEDFKNGKTRVQVRHIPYCTEHTVSSRQLKTFVFLLLYCWFGIYFKGGPWSCLQQECSDCRYKQFYLILHEVNLMNNSTCTYAALIPSQWHETLTISTLISSSSVTYASGND